jgi:hypothetical protein
MEELNNSAGAMLPNLTECQVNHGHQLVAQRSS